MNYQEKAKEAFFKYLLENPVDEEITVDDMYVEAYYEVLGNAKVIIRTQLLEDIRFEVIYHCNDWNGCYIHVYKETDSGVIEL